MGSSRRDLIRMTEAEATEFLSAKQSLQVGTIDPDGSVHLSTLWYAVVDGCVVFETYRKSQKIRKLERDNRITVLIEDGSTYEVLRGLIIKGRAVLLNKKEEVVPIAEAVLRRNQKGIPEEHIEEAAVRLAAKRTAVIVLPEKVVSWDHRKLGDIS